MVLVKKVSRVQKTATWLADCIGEAEKRKNTQRLSTMKRKKKDNALIDNINFASGEHDWRENQD